MIASLTISESRFSPIDRALRDALGRLGPLLDTHMATSRYIHEDAWQRMCGVAGLSYTWARLLIAALDRHYPPGRLRAKRGLYVPTLQHFARSPEAVADIFEILFEMHSASDGDCRLR